MNKPLSAQLHPCVEPYLSSAIKFPFALGVQQIGEFSLLISAHGQTTKGQHLIVRKVINRRFNSQAVNPITQHIASSTPGNISDDLGCRFG